MLGWPKAAAPRFDVVLGDIFAHDWSDTDFFFCNGLLFNNDIMEQIYQKTLKAKKGSWFMTTSKRFHHSEKIDDDNPARDDMHWEFILSIKIVMSWGPATVNLHRKRTHPIQ